MCNVQRVRGGEAELVWGKTRRCFVRVGYCFSKLFVGIACSYVIVGMSVCGVVNEPVAIEYSS